MEFKKSYTKEEVDELVNWFKEHEKELPASMQIDESAYSPDLKKTVAIFCEQSRIYFENPTFNSSIRMLYRIKEIIEQEKKK